MRLLLAAAILAVLVTAGAWRTGALDRLEHDTVDLRFAARGAEPPDDLLVVAVDDATFGALRSTWPLPRSRYAAAIDRLRALGAREVVLDVQFTEPTEPEEDLALYDAIDRFGGAVLATTESDGRGGTNVLGGDANLAGIGARAAASNLPDAELGVVRRYVTEVGGLDTLAVAVAERAGRPVDRAAMTDPGAWIDFRGPPGTVPTVSLAELLDGRVDPGVVRGRTVVVGASAPSVGDVHPTPTARNEVMSGPEIQANAIWTVLHGLPLRDAPPVLALALIVALGLAIPLAAGRLRPLSAVVLAPVLAAGYAAAAHLAFAGGLVLPVAAPLLALALGAVATTGALLALASAERRVSGRYQARLENEVAERTAELQAAKHELVHRLARAVEVRDEQTGEHLERMSGLCRELALAAGLGDREADLLGQASVLHDVGKIAIPDGILRKPGRLDAEEWAIMQTHAAVGGDLLAGSDSPLLRLAESVARTHHERWDGSGYPLGLVGPTIPLAGRITAICDVFDALTSDRPYKTAWSQEDALAEIAAQAGRQFDPELAARFLALLGAGETGLEAGELVLEPVGQGA